MALKFKARIPDKSVGSIQRKLKELKAPISPTTGSMMGKAVVKAMKSEIGRGKSPIEGNGSFPSYQGGYKRQIQRKGYVSVGGRRVSKRLKPVNLKLTGQFLKRLTFRVLRGRSGGRVSIGFFDRRSQKIESGHREGANNQAERPVIPVGDERFNRKITRIYLKILNQAIRKIGKSKK